MKKLIAFIFTILIILSSVSASLISSANFNSEEITKNLKSYAYYMISLDDSSEMFSKNENEKVSPAAFCKMLGAIVAIENWQSLDETVKVTEKSLSLIKYDYGVRTAGIEAGDTYTKRQLIDCMVVYSANDAASVIAYEVAGSAEAFVKKMQETADKIGCKNTKIVDMLGFDAEGQYTTAKDVSLIIKHGLNYPAFNEAFCATSVTMPASSAKGERTYQGSNKMRNVSITDYYHSSVVGGKQTSTDEAGECIAVKSTEDGYSYLTVVMKGKLEDIDNDKVDENTCMVDAKKMLDCVYKNIALRVVASPGQIIDCVDIAAARDTDTLQLTAEKEVSVLAPKNTSVNSVLYEIIEESVPENIKAPVNKGDIICQAKVLYANKELATINLVAAGDVGLSLFGLFIEGVSAVLKSGIFIALEVIALIVLTALAIIKLNEMRGGEVPQLEAIIGGKAKSDKKESGKKSQAKPVKPKAKKQEKKIDE